MAFDGGIARKIALELNEAIDSRIEKIYQPSSDGLVILLRKKGFAERLLVSVRAGAARVHFTTCHFENPESPPMFCMLLRKHFTGAKLLSVTTLNLERVITFTFEGVNEMGDRVNLRLVCELIGNQSNVVLVNEQGRIIDALRRSDISASRLILPGAVYEYPKSQEKLYIIESSLCEAVEKITKLSEIPLSKGIVDTLSGISPLVAREIAFRVEKLEPFCNRVSKDTLKKQLNRIKNELLTEGKPYMLVNAENLPWDFSYTEISQYEGLYSLREYPSYSTLLDAFYSEREKAAQIKRLSSDISRLVTNLISRAKKRMLLRKEELKKCDSRETLRIYGELIKANIYSKTSGSSKATLQNFYDEELKPITVPLDPALNAQGNAARYFKEYKKSCVAAVTLAELVKKDKEEIEYLEAVFEALSRCDTALDIEEIREELRGGGYIKDKNKSFKKKSKAAVFKEYKSVEGYKILVGKNNTQNDILTTKTAAKNDLWFHTKNIHGSHVVVFCGGREVCDETIIFAATLAAENSKAKGSSNVPVDYTYVKNVKKPNGAKPGMVIYTTNKTVFVKGEVEK